MSSSSWGHMYEEQRERAESLLSQVSGTLPEMLVARAQVHAIPALAAAVRDTGDAVENGLAP